MAERILKTPQGRLNNFDRRKDEFAHKRYIDEVLGDAGVTDFSDQARQKLEDLAAYDKYMQQFGKDQRDPFDRHLDAVDSGEVASKDDVRIRRIALLASDIMQMEADGRGNRVADNSGKTVLDYRKERLQELEDEYARGTVREHSTTPDEEVSEPAVDTEMPGPAYAEGDKVEDYPESDDVETSQTGQDKADEDVSEPANPPHTPGAGVDPNEKIGETKKDSDPYQVGSPVRVWLTPRDKDTKVEDSVTAQLVFAVIKNRSEDGQSFEVEVADATGKTSTQKTTREYLEKSNKIMLPEFNRNPDGSLRWKEWTITEGPDTDGDVKLTDGHKTIARNHNSLAMWRHLRITDPESKKLVGYAQEESKREFIDGLKAGAEKSPARTSSERNDSRARRFMAREKAALAQQTKEDREELKQYLRAGYNGAMSLTDRYNKSAFGRIDRKAASWVGSRFKNRKPLSEQAKKATRKLAKQNKQAGNQRGKKSQRWINVK